MPQVNKESTVRWFNELSMKDVPIVGGKNASLGEMISQLSNTQESVCLMALPLPQTHFATF